MNTPATQRPNVLVIMSDQHHPRFLGCAGEGLVQTPALDRLAARGVRMSSAYCAFPLCGPSRMSFMSCRYPSRIDCLDNGAQLSGDVPTFAHGFLAAGYETILSGRMHFVGLDQRHGFERRLISDVTTAFVNSNWKLAPVLGDLVDTPGYSRAAILKSGPGRTGYHAYDQAVTSATVEWMEQRHREQRGNGRPESAGGAAGAAEKEPARPFMMVVGYVSPHSPFVAPPEDYQPYHEALSEDDLPAVDLDTLHPLHRQFRRNAGLEPEPLPLAAQRRARAAYYGLCTFIDRQVGLVLDALERSGLADNTIVVYTSDHGEQIGEHGLWWKSTFYEASAGVPMIVAWPGRLPGGRVAKSCVSLIDVGPTLLDLAGAAALPDVDGRSFRSLLGEAGSAESLHGHQRAF